MNPVSVFASSQDGGVPPAEDDLGAGGVTSISDPALLEHLAAIEHERWAGWQRHFHAKCQRNEDGSLTVPAGYVAALERLIETPYADLGEEQKENDRVEVRKTLVALSGFALSVSEGETGMWGAM
jgi:hypothetical protein